MEDKPEQEQEQPTEYSGDESHALKIGELTLSSTHDDVFVLYELVKTMLKNKDVRKLLSLSSTKSGVNYTG